MLLNIENILRLTQEQLLEFCYNKLIERNYKEKEIIVTEDYIYAKGNIPILLVAHCDIVHKQAPELIVHDRKQRILWSPTGIGGDDRCGVYALLKICEQVKPYILFTTEEEKGGLGVRKFTQEIKDLPVNFIVEIDRKGNEEVVFYQCGNNDFQNYIMSFGFNKEYGSYSDVSTLSTHYDIAGCNVSAGYYNQHTTTEFIYMVHLENTIEKVLQILQDGTEPKFYDCQEVKYKPANYNYSYYYDLYDDDYDKNYYWDYKEQKYKKRKKLVKQKENYQLDEYWDKMVEKEDDYDTLTDKEWKDKYGQDKPSNILEIYKEV